MGNTARRWSAADLRLGSLAWAAATVPTPLGDLEVEARAEGGVTMRVPDGAVAAPAGRTWRGRVQAGRRLPG